MFKTMSQNPPERPGKHSDDKSAHARATHFSFGDSTMGEEKTQVQMHYTGFGDQKLERTKPVPKHTTQICMGETATHYGTTKSVAFVDMPKNFVRARPQKTKQELTKTNYSVS